MNTHSHSSSGKLGIIGLALLIGALTGYGQGDPQVKLPAVLLLGSSFLLGSLSPRLSWLWGAALGLSLVTANLIGAMLNVPPPFPASWPPMIVLPLLFAFAGALSHTLTRRIFSLPPSSGDEE